MKTPLLSPVGRTNCSSSNTTPLSCLRRLGDMTKVRACSWARTLLSASLSLRTDSIASNEMSSEYFIQSTSSCFSPRFTCEPLPFGDPRTVRVQYNTVPTHQTIAGPGPSRSAKVSLSWLQVWFLRLRIEPLNRLLLPRDPEV